MGKRWSYNNASYLEFHNRNRNWEVWDILDIWELPMTQSLQFPKWPSNQQIDFWQNETEPLTNTAKRMFIHY